MASLNYFLLLITGSRRGRDRMVVWFTTTHAISAYHHSRCEFESRSDEAYSIQHYVINFVSDLRHVGGFLQDQGRTRRPPPKMGKI